MFLNANKILNNSSKAHFLDINEFKTKKMSTTACSSTEVTETETQEEESNEINSCWQVASSKNQKSVTKQTGAKKKKAELQIQSTEHLINDIFNIENVEFVRKCVNKGEKCLVILRGCPGSGKSTLAK